MSKLRDALKAATRARGPKDAFHAIKTHLGGKASAWIAEQEGVHVRTAQKWLAGDQSPRADRIERLTSMAPPEWLEADVLRNAQMIDAGHVDVVSKSSGKAAGVRKVGVIHITADMRSTLNHTADLIDAGAQNEADQVINDLIIDAYGETAGGMRGTRGSASAVITIANYRTGLHIM